MYTFLIVLISILLENIFNIYLTSIPYIIPLFTLLSLIFIYPKYKKDKYKYYFISFIIGLIYDIFFTDFYIVNACLFLLISIFIYYILNNHKINIFTILTACIFSIFLYNILIYLILNFFNYTNYSLMDLSYILRNFLLINIIYTILLYQVFKKRYKI